VPATLAAEALVFGIGLWMYVRLTASKDRQGTFALWLFAALMVALYLASLFGPPPGDAKSLAWAALAQWLIAPWGWWIDAHRTVRSE
jgi:hypothetical protein